MDNKTMNQEAEQRFKKELKDRLARMETRIEQLFELFDKNNHKSVSNNKGGNTRKDS